MKVLMTESKVEAVVCNDEDFEKAEGVAVDIKNPPKVNSVR